MNERNTIDLVQYVPRDILDLQIRNSDVERKISGVEAKLTAKIDGVEAKLTEKIDRVEATLTEKIARVDDRVGNLGKAMKEGFNNVDKRIGDLQKSQNIGFVIIGLVMTAVIFIAPYIQKLF